MNENEPKESKPTTEDEKTTQQVTKQAVDQTRDDPKPLKVVENDALDIRNVQGGSGECAEDGIDADADGDSEAETLIQSPEKKRGSIVEGSTVVHQVKVAGSDAGSIVMASTSDKENATRKTKRSQEEGTRATPSPASSHHSSPLSSPQVHMHSDEESDNSAASSTTSSLKRRSSGDAQDEISVAKKRRRRPSEILPPSPSHKRSKRSSQDTAERRETRSATFPRPSDDEKSLSPEPVSRREHRRGASTQLTAGEFEKKKRGRPPLINTRRNRSADRTSNSSEESGPRSSRARPQLAKFASNDHDTMSPAKVGPRKWKDKNGRTYLARACANNDLDAAKARLAERPEDLNMEDNAGNTPLQIASLEGFETMVEFLLLAGAEVNARNVDKDTPLIDAVENGHIEVIKLLLKHGANPRMGNAKGDEPYELVHPDDDAYAEIRAMLAHAKDKDNKKTPGVEVFDPHIKDGVSSRAASAASPRDSPPIGVPRSPPAFGSRRRTGRSESTRNDLLWQANTQENLARLASKGDVQGVASILSILEKAETESLIAAAKAGHEEVLQLLIAMGKPDPDPDPVRGPKMVPGYNTPMLAAIGRGHPDVVKLLANQSGFNPTRKYRDRTYYELADERKGDRWEQEVNILKAAYDRARGKKSSSPRKTRDAERIKPRRRSSSVTSAKRQMPSPSITHKSLTTKSPEVSPREQRKVSDPMSDRHKVSDDAEMSIAVASDADQTGNAQKKTHRTRRSQSDLPPVPTLEHEASTKRRRLVTGKEHRSRQTVSTSSDNDETEMLEVKDEDKLQPPLKRSRVSSTSDAVDDAKERKKRRTVLESSPDDTRFRTDTPLDLVPPVSTANSEMQSTENEQAVETMSNVDEHAQEPAIAPGEDVKQESPLVHEAVLMNDPEALPDVAEESDDHYSPPPAVEPPDESLEEERKAREQAEKLAAEETARQEEQRKAHEEKLAQEKAAEEARLQREADQKRKLEEEQARRRQEEERQERLKQELESRKRLEQLEQERRRVDALPVVLARTAQMIDDNTPEVRGLQWLSKFLPLYTVRTKQLDPYCTASEADDEWVPNFQVAGLLATKDLRLRNFTSFDTRPVSEHERQCLWRVARLKLSYDFNPLWTTTVSRANEIEFIAQEKFISMQELFWVKVSWPPYASLAQC